MWSLPWNVGLFFVIIVVYLSSQVSHPFLQDMKWNMNIGSFWNFRQHIFVPMQNWNQIKWHLTNHNVITRIIWSFKIIFEVRILSNTIKIMKFSASDEDKRGCWCMCQCVQCCSHPPLILTGCREEPRPVFLTEVDNLKRKNIIGSCLLCCSHHPVEIDIYARIIIYICKSC